jgi:aminoglycoside phosphotransferase (APT) family kinase protein
MIESALQALSEQDRETVRAAVVAAFGSAEVSAMTPITGGASGASTFQLHLGDRRFLLRLEGHPSPLRNPHQYVSLRIAAEAGIAPKVHHIDETNRIAVMDFVQQRPLRSYPGGPRALAQALGELLARVQATPAFPLFVNYADIVTRLFAHVCRTGLFAPGLLDRYVERLELLREAYNAGGTELVSSHNDSIPSNILFDGIRLWMIDWESAYRNDPLVDVAIMLDNFAPSQDLQHVFLDACFKRSLDAGARARLELIKALTRLYYAGVLLSASAAASWICADTDLRAPNAEDFQQAIRLGRLRAGTPETKHILGKMFLASFLCDVRPPGLETAV